MIEKTGIIRGLDLPQKAEHTREIQQIHKLLINHLDSKGNYSAISNNMKWYTGY